MNTRMMVVVGIVALCCVLNGCWTSSGVAHPEKRMFPKAFKYRIVPGGDYSKTGIDFNALYCEMHKREYGGKIYTPYACLRFWPNGRVIERHLSSLPDKQEAERFYEGNIGYYIIDNGQILTEVCFPDGVTKDWIYGRDRYTYEKDVLVRQSTEVQGRVTRNEVRYFPVKYDVLDRSPDW